MMNHFKNLAKRTAKTLALILSLIFLTSYTSPTGEANGIKKGDKIEYQVTGEKNDRAVIAMFMYYNETGSQVNGLRTKPSALNRSFVAQRDNQPVRLLVSLDPGVTQHVVHAKILVNGELVQNGSTGNGVSMVDLLIGR